MERARDSAADQLIAWKMPIRPAQQSSEPNAASEKPMLRGSIDRREPAAAMNSFPLVIAVTPLIVDM
ncbi:hypothetical protein K7G81_12800 [Hephaestia sp. CMS5P-6]|nr:hypothetical protein [Hephaestia mangrovi]